MYINSLDYDKDEFLWGEDVITEYGVIRFLTFKEYKIYSGDLQLIGQNVLHIYYHYFNEMKKKRAKKKDLDELKEMKKESLLNIVKSTPLLLNAYLRIFSMVFDRNSEGSLNFKNMFYLDEYGNEKVSINRMFSDEPVDFDSIFDDNELFLFIRKIVMDMNVVVEERVSPNEVIQQAFERSARIKQRGGQKNTTADIVTSIVASTSHGFKEVGDMTVFQVYLLFARIGAIFNHKATTLFATVAEKVEVESWNKHINLFEEEVDTMTHDQFNKKFGGMLGG